MLKGTLQRYEDSHLDEAFGPYVEDVPAYQADTHGEIELWCVSIITFPEKKLTCVAVGQCNTPIEKHALVTDWHRSRKATKILAGAVFETLESICQEAFWKAFHSPGLVIGYQGASIPGLG